MSIKLKILLNLFLLVSLLNSFFSRSLYSQDLTINWYISMYYATDNDPNANTNRSLVNYLNIEKDKFDVNIAMITFAYNKSDYRSKITLQEGQLPKNAWQKPLNMLQEANIGVKLIDNLWLDGGYFLTHIGNEAITPKDNYLSTLALSTHIEPNFQSGLKLTYDYNENLQLQVMLLNGYNLFEDDNLNKTLGWFAS